MISYNNFPPIPNEICGNWIAFSMHSLEGISCLLKKFPQIGDEKGCSASLIWTGVARCNTPSFVYQGQTIGIVLDPHYVVAPQADLIAYGSGAKLADEIDKPMENKKSHSTSFIKKGYMRNTPDYSYFAANLAKLEIVHEQEGNKAYMYHEKGNLEIFAKNVWRKYHKKHKKADKYIRAFLNVNQPIVQYNEAIVFQKTNNPNPITGLLMLAIPEKNILEKIYQILDETSSINLFLYNSYATSHIVRIIVNEEAKIIINDIMHNNEISFSDLFDSSNPFMGLNQLAKKNLTSK